MYSEEGKAVVYCSAALCVDQTARPHRKAPGSGGVDTQRRAERGMRGQGRDESGQNCTVGGGLYFAGLT